MGRNAQLGAAVLMWTEYYRKAALVDLMLEQVVGREFEVL